MLYSTSSRTGSHRFSASTSRRLHPSSYHRLFGAYLLWLNQLQSFSSLLCPLLQIIECNLVLSLVHHAQLRAKSGEDGLEPKELFVVAMVKHGAGAGRIESQSSWKGALMRHQELA